MKCATLKVRIIGRLLTIGIPVAVFMAATTAGVLRAGKPCPAFVKYGICTCAALDNTRVGPGIKKAPVVSTLAAPTCSHGAAWGCSKCGHIPPSQGIRDLKDLGRPSPLRPRVTEVPLRRVNKSRHYDAKAKPDRADVLGYPRCAGNYCPGPSCGGVHGAVLDSAAKTRSGKLIDRSSSTRTTPHGQNSYRRGAAGANGALDGKVTVCERCGGSCTDCRCSGGYPPPGIRSDIGGHLMIEATGIVSGRRTSSTRPVPRVRRTPVSRSATGRPHPRENNVNRPRPAPSRGATIQDQLKGVKSLNRFRR
mgnify:CR=1 FL=1